jgi:cell wall-associated NlpC family hydrolase
MVLRIPARSIHAAIPAAPKGAAYHTVRNGENDWTIAHKHGLTLAQLKALNPNISFDNLQIGARIAVPAPKSAAPVVAVNTKKATVKVAAKGQPAKAVAKAQPKVVARTYKVQKNENDWIVAHKFDTTVKHLRELNPGVNTDVLQIGQVIRVPGIAVAAKSTSTKVAMNKPNRIRTKYAKVTGENSIIRRGAKTSAEQVTMVDSGTQVVVLDYLNGWYKLRFPKGTVGWMRGDLLKPVKTIDVIRENRAHDVVAKAEPKSEKHTKTVVAKNESRPKVVASHPSTPKARLASLHRPGAPVGSTRVNGVLTAALSLRGSRYSWGATGRGGAYDCSGFVGAVFKQNGVSLPRISRDIAQVGQHVSRDDLKPGDILYFHTGRGSRVSHVGIYKGNGEFIHASSGKGRVTVSSLNDGYYSRHYSGATRVLKGGGSSTKVAKKSSSKKKEEHEVDAAPAEGPN